MQGNRSGGNTHRDLVVGLMTDHLPNLSSGLASCYSLPRGGRGDEVSVFEEPYLDGRNGRLYPDILAVLRCGGALFSAIIEVKRTPSDLLDSRRQYAGYLGYTSAFFIAVPAHLIHVAVAEIRYPYGLMQFKGVINADNGDIVIKPKVQRIDPARELNFLTRAFAGGHKGICVPGHALDAPPKSDGEKYVTVDDMMVREAYLPIVMAESRRGYQRDVYYDRYAGGGAWGKRTRA